MGFGVLLFGYFFLYAMPFNSVDCFAHLFGGLLVWRALSLLRQYRAEFALCRYPMLAVIPIDALLVVEWILRVSGNAFAWQETASFWIRSVRDVLLLFFNLLLLFAIRAIAREVELPTLAGKALRNTVIVLFYAGLTVISLICHLAGWTLVTGYLNPTLVLLVLVIWLLMIAHLFSCYKNICAPEDLDMDPPDSPFAFINRFRRKERERNQEIYDNAKARAEKDLIRRMEKKKERDAKRAERKHGK